jgi:hypothetical protein
VAQSSSVLYGPGGAGRARALLQAGLGSHEGRATVEDIPNFATGGATIFFAEIV